MGVAPFRLSRSSQVLLADLGVSTADVLRVAGLPADLFARPEILLPPVQYYALWEALDEVADVPHLPLAVGRAVSLEMFDPPIFAATCSPDLHVAAERIAVHKRLCGPLRLGVERSSAGLELTFTWPPGPTPPPSLVATELVFWVALARLATRTHVAPQRLTAPVPPADVDAYRSELGTPIEAGDTTAVRFSALDASRPFLTSDPGMWDFFEPELRRRLDELDAADTTGERVRRTLLETLPAGGTTMAAVARRLGTSTRTLQRRLAVEGTTFQALLSDTRESLARHYLSTSHLPVGEIAFLLGYDDPNSFYRAFHAWTGETPQRIRTATA
jgi:AraC-like DNA-binding protein